MILNNGRLVTSTWILSHQGFELESGLHCTIKTDIMLRSLCTFWGKIEAYFTKQVPLKNAVKSFFNSLSD